MNQLSRIEAKLDALLAKAGLDPAKVIPPPVAIATRVMTPQEQDAIDNAPKVGLMSGPIAGPRVTDTNAPDVSASTPPVAPIGSKRKG